MNICVAFVRLKSGTEAVLRGSPAAVSEQIERAFDKAGGAEILCQVQDDVTDQHKENDLWLYFVGEAMKVGLSALAKQKHEIWRRKANFLWHPERWEFDLTDEYLCIFMGDSNDMVLQGPDRNKAKPRKKKAH